MLARRCNLPTAPAGRSAGWNPVRACTSTSRRSIRVAAQAQPSQAAEVASSSGDGSSGQKTFHHGITYVSYEGNCFWVKFNNSGARVLVDPWLVGDLSFFEQGWLYTGKKRGFGGGSGVQIDVREVASDTDVVLITQWVDDHTHMPTLEAMPRDVPIIAQPEAAERIKPLGFKSLTTISPGQSMPLCGGKLQLRATAGALVGPPWSARQNGYALRELGVETPASLYYEPHCDFDASSLAGVGPVDVVVSPVQSVLLAGYPLLKGDTDLLKLLKLLQPKVLVPLLNADLDQEGKLTTLMSVRGSSLAADVRQQLAAAGLSGTKLEYPAPPGESLALAL
ncbi:hypothetical protein OEZ85_011746 [Tetradesmus obliquus]|uniref:Metallo-beta-lactamase domain-containing protein n=1 Tax=Tetradesmus obliquus TaxID=3088 RepID=A0ABY8TW09_TETOB|nr:hypothetical protein OEZ85_011746 [Tetradesmus obliquus]